MPEELCSGCRDGWVYRTDERGYSFAAPCPRCRPERRRSFIEGTASGIPDRYSRASWEAWTERPQLKHVATRLRAWAGEPWSVVLLANGLPNIGAGKTFALSATVRAWRQRGHPAFYLDVRAMLKREGELISRLTGDETGGVRWCSDYRGLLALDDLGAEHEDRSEWAAAAVDAVVDARYRSLLPTVLATNLGPAELAERYYRAFSRLQEGLVLTWIAPDFRGRTSPERPRVHALRAAAPTAAREDRP